MKESAMHLLMMAEAGAPILTGLFLDMNAGALALMGAGWLLHELTVAWDVKYTISRRKIFAREQHTLTATCKPSHSISWPRLPVFIPNNSWLCSDLVRRRLTLSYVSANRRYR
jgi:hypothetical protein